MIPQLNNRIRTAILPGLFWICTAALSGQQVPDTTFHHTFIRKAYESGKGPLILVDEAHGNFHTSGGGFLPFSTLLRDDGYRVDRLSQPISDLKTLKNCRVLVIVNPLHPRNRDDWALPTPGAFTQQEVANIRAWVLNGGSLLLIADHMPFAGAASELASAFGFEFLNGFAFTRENGWPPSEFSLKDQTLTESFLSRGVFPGEDVTRVATFTGSAFRPPKEARNILLFNPANYILLPDTAWQFNSGTKRESLTSCSQGSLLEYGKGRIAVFGEAAFLTAQIANGTFKVGFNSEAAPGNSQFALNLIHWLDGLDKPRVPTLTINTSKLGNYLKRPSQLNGYRPNQRGPLTKLDSVNGNRIDTTFTVENIQIRSGDILINGWLYLPEGSGRFPLIILTNGGGDGSRPIKSLSDWLAPILSHCGYAAFIHDKRGTGGSGGDYAKTTYEDFIKDAGNCAIHLSGDPRINSEKIGIMGGSEGGLIAVSAACRYPEIKFVISQAGTAVSGIQDRLFAQLNGMIDGGALTDSLYLLIRPLWIQSFQAWASGDPSAHDRVNRQIDQWRQQYNRNILPFKKQEMDSIPNFRVLLPTWNSIGFDYLSELKTFNKPWLALFGEADRVVPALASIRNIEESMQISGNPHCTIALIPRCGHSPVDIETKQLIRIDHIIINWLNETIRK